MAEIGSEFWNVPLGENKSGFFDGETFFFLSGRSALKFIIDDIKTQNKVRTAVLPSWCCDSMILPFLEAGLEVRFYTVAPTSGGGVVQRFEECGGCDVILVMDYFGYDSRSEIKGFDGIIIRDLTHSVFSKNHMDADYYFGSLRKWAGFFTGGFAYCANGGFVAELPQKTDGKYVDLRRTAMMKKEEYISGKSSSKSYLEIFNTAEEYLEKAGVFAAVDTDVERIYGLDVEYIKKRRRENAEILLKKFADIAVFPTVSEDECPLFVPILVPDGKRNSLRRYLIENEIYCPIHWPISEFHRISPGAMEVYDNELSLVCDQRYGVSDMERIVEAAERFWRE